MQISNVVEQRRSSDEFHKTVELQISKNGSSYVRKCESQIDTASPISLVISKFIPSNLILEGRYEGINGSVLEILGQIEVKISDKDLGASDVTFRVVSDHAMKCDTILGRDAIKTFGLTLIKQEEKCEKKISEILNIESSVSESDESENLDVNPKLSSEMRDKFIRDFHTTCLQIRS